MTAPPPPSTSAAGNAGGRFFGVLLMAIGVLIAGLSGLCSLAFFAMMMSGPGNNAGVFFGGVVMVLIIGGLPFGVGVVLIIVGRSVYRSAKPRADPNVFS